MPRKKYERRPEVLPDPKYNSALLTRFNNVLMIQGKKSTAEGIIYKMVKIVEEKTGQEGIAIVKQAIQNIKPVVEVKSRRVGGATYQVPVEVRPDRRLALALRWGILYAKSRPDHTMEERLAAELIAAAKNKNKTI